MLDDIDSSIADCIRNNFYHITKQKPFLHTWQETTQLNIQLTLTQSQFQITKAQ